MQEVDNKPLEHLTGKESLMYYHLVNSLIVKGGDKNIKKAIKLIDECFSKCGLTDDDPLTPKMWVLRGHCCVKIRQFQAADSDFLRCWGIWKHPEAGINLAAKYLYDKKVDKAIEILEEMYNKKEFKMANIPVDMVGIEKDMLDRLSQAYLLKYEEWLSSDIKKSEEYVNKAYKCCVEYFSIDIKNIKMLDRAIYILKKSGRVQEAYIACMNAVNMFPSYWLGWASMGEQEVLANRKITAKMFFEKSLRYAPREQRKQLKINIRSLKK